MDDLVEIYTRLKLKSENIAKVTYYTKDGIKHTDEFYLIDVILFSHIWVVKKGTEHGPIPFFSKELIIESITFKEDNHPTYTNPFLKKLNCSNPFDNYNQLEILMNQIIKLNQEKLTQRKKIINIYLSRIEYVKYDDLFFSQKQKEEFELFFNILVKELSNYAKSNNLDSHLKHTYTGTTSIVYEIGDKIIKIGKPRRTPIIPYCEYLLQPIVNRTLEFDGYPIHLEITQKVRTLNDKDSFDRNIDITKYFKSLKSFLQEKLKDTGLCCDDIILENIGILLEDNKIHFPSITFDTADSKVTSIDNNNNLKILPKGTPVIIDLDCIKITNMKKYTQYLKSIGLNKATKSKKRKLAKK